MVSIATGVSAASPCEGAQHFAIRSLKVWKEIFITEEILGGCIAIGSVQKKLNSAANEQPR